MKGKKYISLVLIFALCFTMTVPAFANSKMEASTIELTGPKTNLHYEQGSMLDVYDLDAVDQDDIVQSVYTYEQNGYQYRVYGENNQALTHAYAEVYRITDEGEVLVRTETVDNINGVIITEIEENGEVDVSFIDTNRQSTNVVTSSGVTVPSFHDGLVSVNATWGGNQWPVNDYYTHYGTFTPNYAIKTITIQAVTTLIDGIVRACSFSNYTKILVPVITKIVNGIVENSIDKTYTIEDVAFRWTCAPGAPVQQRAVERTIRTFYYDKARTAQIDEPVTTYVYDENYNE